MPRERSQTQKRMHCVTPLTENSRQDKTILTEGSQWLRQLVEFEEGILCKRHAWGIFRAMEILCIFTLVMVAQLYIITKIYQTAHLTSVHKTSMKFFYSGLLFLLHPICYKVIKCTPNYWSLLPRISTLKISEALSCHDCSHKTSQSLSFYVCFQNAAAANVHVLFLPLCSMS